MSNQFFRKTIFLAGLIFFIFSASQASAAPVISDLLPNSGPPGAVVSIVGSGFSKTKQNTVYLNPSFPRIVASYISVLDTLRFSIPQGAVPGTYENVKVTNENGTSNGKTFTITGTKTTSPVPPPPPPPPSPSSTLECGISTSQDFCTNCYNRGGRVKPGEAGCWCDSSGIYINAWFGTCVSQSGASPSSFTHDAFASLIKSFESISLLLQKLATQLER